MQFPLLKGCCAFFGKENEEEKRGMFSGEDSKYSEKLPNDIPPTPFKGGEIPCKSPDFVQKNNYLKICKRELNSPAFKGGEIPCKSPDFVQKNNYLKICQIELNSSAFKGGEIPANSEYLCKK